jgi:hypothetical protein
MLIKKINLFILLMLPACAFAQVVFNKDYPDITVSKTALTYPLTLKKGEVYRFSVMKQGIDVELIINDATGKQLIQYNSTNGPNGPARFDYTTPETGDYQFIIKRIVRDYNPEKGKIILYIKKFTKAELELREKIKREMEPENNKVVQTADIDHFWQAFDRLKTCHTYTDSVTTFQTVYLDRATSGLGDFTRKRDLSAEKFVHAVATYPKFYNSIRANTYQVKQAVPLIDELFAKFKAAYPNFKPFKVCFAIGVVETGGTISDHFVLIGTEIATSTAKADLSEFHDNALGKVLASGDENIVQKLKNIIAHECVHTQQIVPLDKNAIGCTLLNAVMKEGFCDFIGELIAGNQINNVAQTYGNQHEKGLWNEFKNEICSDNTGNWLYNYSTTKNRPADLGYYIGYKIAEAYYKNATDKTHAFKDIIEMNNPLQFLERSGYDQQTKINQHPAVVK